MGCFVRRNLKQLGMLVQLGHPRGEGCSAPRSGPSNFINIHSTGIQPVSIIYCACLNAPPRRIQLMRFGWFPGTVEDPHTAATMNCLRDFHVKNLQSAQSAYDYYGSLKLLSDACSLSPPLVRLFAIDCIDRN